MNADLAPPNGGSPWVETRGPLTVRHPLLAFFSLTYLVSWISFGAAALISRTSASGSPPFTGVGNLVDLLGVFAPSLVALGLTARTEGSKGTEALLARIARFPAGVRWYVFAVGYIAVIKLTAALLHRVVLGTWPVFGETPWYVMAGAVILSTPVQAGEEVGWRGYALPRLAERLGLAGASLALGLIWACWHLPFFFIAGTDKSGQSFLIYAMGVTALSVAMAWLYWRTDGSLLLVMLMHAAVNNTKDIVPSVSSSPQRDTLLGATPIAWLTTAVLWIGAGYFQVRMGRARFPSNGSATPSAGFADPDE
jgi:membrane protease YdiL (CAAX protease family)